MWKAASAAEASLDSSHQQLFRPAGWLSGWMAGVDTQAKTPFNTHLLGDCTNKRPRKQERNGFVSQPGVGSVQCPRQLTRRERAADMFPLTVSPKRATKSTGSFVNLCTAAPSPKKKVRLATAEILGVTPLSAITSAACPAPPAALAGEAATLHHEGLKTTYPPHLLCNSSHVTACPFKLTK